MVLFSFLFVFSMITQTSDPLDQYEWKNRILVIHEAGKPDEVQKTLDEIFETREEWEDRNMILVHIKKDEVKIGSKALTDKDALTLRSKFPSENKNRFLLIGKDGGVKLDRYGKINILEVYQLIDQMPMRRSEMRSKGRNR